MDVHDCSSALESAEAVGVIPIHAATLAAANSVVR
jgi:hypothetical protein